MLDVVHVFFEEDITPRHEQDIEIKDKVRERLYPALYNRPYRYGTSTGHMGPVTREKGTNWDEMPELDESPVGSGAKAATKPYIPPTPIEDLPGILQAPLR